MSGLGDEVLARVTGIGLAVAIVVDAARGLPPALASGEAAASWAPACAALCGSVAGMPVRPEIAAYAIGEGAASIGFALALAPAAASPRAASLAGCWLDPSTGAGGACPGRASRRALARLRRASRLRLPGASLRAMAPSGTLSGAFPWMSAALAVCVAAGYGRELWLSGSWCIGGRVPSPAMMAAGAVYGPDVLSGSEPWRLLTGLLVHLSWSHLGSNLAGGALACAAVERTMGASWLLCIFMLGGLLSSMASVAANPGVFSMGCSGAITAVAAAGLCVRARLVPESRSRAVPALAVVLASALFPVTWVVPSAAVDYWGHAGGAAAGLALGSAALACWPRGEARPRHSDPALSAGLFVAGLAAIGEAAMALG